MTTPLITIIIPAYNVDKTISRVIKYIKLQTFVDFEAIIVNDGSIDQTEELITSKIADDPRFRLINKKNGGASSARNEGIKQARGKWLVFMDADDEIGPDYLSVLYNHRIKDGLCMAGFYENNNGNIKVSVDFGEGIYDKSAGTFYKLLQNKIFFEHPSPIAKIFDRDIIFQNNILFDPEVCLFEDLLFWLQYLLYAKKITTIKPVEYIYLKDNSNLTKRPPIFNSSFKLATSYTDLTDVLCDQLKVDICDEIKSRRAMLLMTAVLSLYNDNKPRDERLALIRQIKQSYREILKDYNAPTHLMKFKKQLLLSTSIGFDLYCNVTAKR